MAGKIKIDPERCKGCGLCIEVCPKNSITISSKTNTMGYFFAEPCGDGCTGCAVCALICPDAAIEVYRDAVQAVSETSSEQNKVGLEKT
jgi:2-oxoglutarate ferredoxin oxidoreductase subunit delta